MPVQNTDIAAQLNRMADLLEIEGANPFRIRAYRNAARTVNGLARPVADLIKNKEDLTGFPGIGQDLADKIQQIVSKGTFTQLEEIQGRLPEELPRMMEIDHLGPKRVKQLYLELGISNTEALKTAARAKKIRTVKGFGKKIEQSVLTGLEQMAWISPAWKNRSKKLKRSMTVWKTFGFSKGGRWTSGLMEALICLMKY